MRHSILVILACRFSSHIAGGTDSPRELGLPSLVSLPCELHPFGELNATQCNLTQTVAAQGRWDVLVPQDADMVDLKYEVKLENNLAEESASPISVSVTSGITLTSARRAVDPSATMNRSLFCFATANDEPVVISTTPSGPANLSVKVLVKPVLMGSLSVHVRELPQLHIINVSKEMAASGEVHVKLLDTSDLNAGKGEVRVFLFPHLHGNQSCLKMGLHPDNRASNGCVNTEALITCLNPTKSRTQSVRFTVATKGTVTLSRFSWPTLVEGPWFILFDPSSDADRRYEVRLEDARAHRGSVWRAFPYLFLPCIIVFFLEVVHQFVRLLWHAHQNNEPKVQKIRESLRHVRQFSRDMCSWTWWKFVQQRIDANLNHVSFSAQVFIASLAFFVAASQIALSLWNQGFLDRDVCYYNFECYAPDGVDLPVNKMLSHIPYFTIGGLLVVFILHWEYSWRHKPCDLGVFYGLAYAIFLEGIGSMTYHMCPEAPTFQFDSAMMFVIVILSTLALHEEKEAQAVITPNGVILFFVLPMWIVSFMGTWFDYLVPETTRSAVQPRPFFQACTVGWTIFTIFSFRKLFRDETRKSCRRCCLVFLRLMVVGLMLFVAFDRPLRLDVGGTSNALLGISLLVMICVVGREMWVRQVVRSDCGIVEFVMKSWFFFVFLCFTVVALWFFEHPVADVTVTPAESREINKGCIIADYFDNHDTWHALSAIALGLWVLVLLEIRLARTRVPGFVPDVLEMGSDETEENEL